MKLCITEIVREDRIERVISDETVLVVSSPIILRRKKKAAHPILKGLIRAQQYPIQLYQDFIAIEKLYDSCADEDDSMYANNYKLWAERHNLNIKIDRIPAYWWIYQNQKNIKEEIFTYLFKTGPESTFSYDLISKFEKENALAKQWGILRYSATVPILQKYRIINKLLDELIIIKLAE